MSVTTLVAPMGSASRQKRVTSAAYYTAYIGLGLVAASLGPTLPGLAANTGAQLSTISMLFMARSLGYLGGATVAGWLYDRRAGNPVIAVAILAISLLMALVPITPLLWLLVMIVLVIGLAEGLMDVGGNTLLVWLHHPDVGMAMNALHFFFGIGALLAPLIVAQVIAYSGGISWAYWTIALLLAPIALWLLRLPSPQSVSLETKRASEAVDWRLTGLIIGFLFLYVGVEVGFSSWIYTYAVAQASFSATQAAYLNSAFWGAFTLGRLFSIPLAARLQPRYLLIGELLLAIAFVGMILLWPTSQQILWIGVCGAGLAICALFPVTLTWAGRHMTMTGRITSWIFIGASIGGMFFPWFIGQLFEKAGPLITVITVMACLTVDLAIFIILMTYAGQPKFVLHER